MALRISAPNLILPWHKRKDEDSRFRRILTVSLILLFLLSVVIPFIELPEPEREELEELPPQLARVQLEDQDEPDPAPAPEPEPEAEPEQPQEEAAPEPEPEAAPEPEPEPEPPTPDAVQQARERASRSGVLQFSDDLAEMRESMDVAEVAEADTQEVAGAGEAAQADRSRLASRSETQSGGVSTDELSRETGGAELAGRETTQVENKMAGADPNAGSGDGGGRTSDGLRERSDESIRKTMDRNKNGIFAIYHRALRTDPTLEGRVVVRMVIEPSGRVSSVEIISSDLNDEDLESKILARIRLVDFGEEDVATTTVNYTFDFLPS